jgi:hypothetical protein
MINPQPWCYKSDHVFNYITITNENNDRKELMSLPFKRLASRTPCPDYMYPMGTHTKTQLTTRRWEYNSYHIVVMVIKWECCKNILVTSFGDNYFGDDDNVWIICSWLGDSYYDDDFHVYSFEMINCIFFVIIRYEYMWIIYICD